jgi:hypothetical protein
VSRLRYLAMRSSRIPTHPTRPNALLRMVETPSLAHSAQSRHRGYGISQIDALDSLEIRR